MEEFAVIAQIRKFSESHIYYTALIMGPGIWSKVETESQGIGSTTRRGTVRKFRPVSN